MPSEIEICNLALSHIGKYPISALTDATKEAKECKLLYPRARDSVLRAHAWNFATKRLTLAELAEDYDGWSYAYQYPTDCLVARKIYNSADDNDAIEFEVATNSALSSRVILTDQENAVLIYTARVTDPNVFDSIFVDALSWRLAADLSMPLRADPRVYQQVTQTYMAYIAEARQTNSNEHAIDPDDSCSFLDARG